MNDFDWKAGININILSLKLLGLWPKGDETYKFNLYTIYTTVCVLGLLCTHTFVQTINIYFILHDLEAFTSSIFVTLACIGTVVKVYYLLRNMENLKQLFAIIPDKIFQPKNDRQQGFIKPSILFWRRIYFMFWMVSNMTIFLWWTFPILDKWIRQHRLPFLAWYPYDTTVSPFYEITYIHQSVSIWYLVTASINTDCLIAALNMFVGAQCDILCDDLENLGTNKDDMEKNLVQCIKHHKAIVRFAEKSNEFFHWIVLVQFFTSTVSIGFSMFLLTLVVPFSSQFYSFLSYVSAITQQMFIYCWFGNETEIKSSAIPYAAFKSSWEGTPLTVQKDLIIFTIRTQRPIKMSALNLFYLSLETFKAILRTSWSYFMVLNQVNA